MPAQRVLTIVTLGLWVLEALDGERPALAGLSYGADDGDRTRDPQLGKLMLYQLSYVRAESG